jgi:hypothetical protein
MKIYTLLALSLLFTQILAQFSCGPGQFADHTCCSCRQNPNPSNGNGFLEFDVGCQVGGLHCVADSGCRLCYKPTFGALNVGERPICARFSDLVAVCEDESCCLNAQNPNPTDGNGFFEFDADCKANGGGLHCIADSGCRMCYKPILGGINVGDRPVCRRFVALPATFGFPPNCSDETCCIDNQNPNDLDGNGFLEFNAECKANGGGLHCVHDGGCRLCYKPILGGINIGDRPICERFLNLLPDCNDQGCCLDFQNPNLLNGNGFLEFDAECKVNGGGLHCVHDTGCRMCYKPILGGINVGDRPICERFAMV